MFSVISVVAKDGWAAIFHNFTPPHSLACSLPSLNLKGFPRFRDESN